MSEKRLKEIKDSIDFQVSIAKSFNDENTLSLLQEQLDLYDEVFRLKQENKDLKRKLEDEIECKEIAQGHEENIQINEAYERKEKEKYKNILTEFEKWFEEGKTLENWKYGDMYFGEFCDVALEKLQKLKKEGNK